MLHQFSLLCFSINQIENCHCVSRFVPCQDHNWEGTGFFCRKEIYVQSGFVFFGNASNLVIDFFFLNLLIILLNCLETPIFQLKKIIFAGFF